MEQANIPQQSELNALYGSWNPGAYMRGYENQGLADQFREQAFGANQQAIAKTQQEYDQNALMNPLRVDALKGTNAGQDISNVTNGVASRRAVANEGAVLSEDLRSHALKMTDDEFKKADQHIESLLRSQNPAEQKLGLQLQSTLPSMLAEKRKNDQAMAIQKEQTKSHIGGIGMQNASARELEQMRIDAGKYDKKAKAGAGVAGIQEALQTGKMTYEKAATALHGASMFEPDPELAAKYDALAAQYEQMNLSGKSAGVTGKVDVGAVADLPTQSVPTVIKPAGATPPKADHSFADLQKMYPGVDAATLKQAYKAKYGTEPK